MPVAELTEKDLGAVLRAVGARLGSDDTRELRDVLVILETQGLVQIEVTPRDITVKLPILANDPPVRILRT
jgi:hypothetical protein